MTRAIRSLDRQLSEPDDPQIPKVRRTLSRQNSNASAKSNSSTGTMRIGVELGECDIVLLEADPSQSADPSSLEQASDMGGRKILVMARDSSGQCTGEVVNTELALAVKQAMLAGDAGGFRRMSLSSRVRSGCFLSNMPFHRVTDAVLDLAPTTPGLEAVSVVLRCVCLTWLLRREEMFPVMSVAVEYLPILLLFFLALFSERYDSSIVSCALFRLASRPMRRTLFLSRCEDVWMEFRTVGMPLEAA